MTSSQWLAAIAVLALLAGTAAAYVSLQGRVNPMATQVPVTSTIGEVEPNRPLETATFGAGCFWGVEAAFRQVKGVKSTSVGYLGGNYKNPTYKDVCTGTTGHAEVVQVEFDPTQVTYEKLLDVFWSNHNPTTRNRHGPEVGTQYRSAIFFHNHAQKAAAEASKKKQDASGKHRGPIVTEITPASEFYKAEDYHQQYLEKRGLSRCHI